MNRIKYSVIIISFNEEENISKCIQSIRKTNQPAQIIVSDGGSSDATVKLAAEVNIEIVFSEPGRGIQCNRGAEQADGEILLFLHADTILPENSFVILDEYFSNDEVKIGSFRLSFDSDNPILNFYSKFSSIDSIFTRYGDQCIVIRKNFLRQLGGFKNWPLYEDVDLFRRARRLTKIYSFPASIITSSRRYMDRGVIKQQVSAAWNIILFLCGKSPFGLAKRYNSLRIFPKIQTELSLKKPEVNSFSFKTEEK